MGKNYYPKMYLEECKYIVKENQIDKNIEDDLEISSGYNLTTNFLIKRLIYQSDFRNFANRAIKFESNCRPN